VLTVWETLPWRRTFRWPRERRYREAVLGELDLCLAMTERARDGLRLEGVPDERIVVSPPGVALERFAPPADPVPAPAEHTILSAGRLVWEKGHQDVLRAVAALRDGLLGEPRRDVRLLVAGDGPEGPKLRAYARELGLDGAVEFRATVPYDAMPGLYHGASALVLGSLPVRAWEEQFGMVLVEAMAAGTPIVATTTGAIPEVLGSGAGTALVAPGDWRGMAAALLEGPLARPPAQRVGHDAARLERFSAAAEAGRLAAAYGRLLGR
jgi:glycosyltransferase involved in cell wall biosynthesis